MMTPYDRSIYYTSANMPVRCVMCKCDEIVTEPRTEDGYDANDERVSVHTGDISKCKACGERVGYYRFSTHRDSGEWVRAWEPQRAADLWGDVRDCSGRVFTFKGEAAFIVGIAKNERGINQVFFKRADNDTLETMIFVDFKANCTKVETATLREMNQLMAYHHAQAMEHLVSEQRETINRILTGLYGGEIPDHDGEYDPSVLELEVTYACSETFNERKVTYSIYVDSLDNGYEDVTRAAIVTAIKRNIGDDWDIEVVFK